MAITLTQELNQLSDKTAGMAQLPWMDGPTQSKLTMLSRALKGYTKGKLDQLHPSAEYRVNSLCNLIKFIQEPGSLKPELRDLHRVEFQIGFIVELNYLVSDRVMGIYHNLGIYDGTETLRKSRDALVAKK